MAAATIVTYPGGSASEPATVTAVHDAGDRRIVVTDITPFHPLDPWWPDQPSDVGTIRLGEDISPVERAVLVGVSEADPECRVFRLDETAC